MQKISKLKSTNRVIVLSSILFILITASIFIIIKNYADYDTKMKIFGTAYVIFSLINLVIWFISKNLISLSMIMICLAMAVSYFSDYKGIYVTVPLIIFWLFYGYFLFLNFKFNSNYKKILELAAKPVDGTADGFSSRPLPAGKAQFTETELYRFADFLRKHFIASPYAGESSVLLVLTDQNRFWFGRPNDQRDSYISFNFNGKISVNIARKDYNKYKKEYTFDELCHSFGNVFKRFLEHYQQGNELKILKELAD